MLTQYGLYSSELRENLHVWNRAFVVPDIPAWASWKMELRAYVILCCSMQLYIYILVGVFDHHQYILQAS